MSDVDMGPTYACGNRPEVGDVIEFGTRHTRLLVSRVIEDAGQFGVSCDGHEYTGESFTLMRLIARHGVAIPCTGVLNMPNTLPLV